MNIFDILFTSTQGQNLGEGQGHSGNDVLYTRSHWEFDLVSMYDQFWTIHTCKVTQSRV